MEIFGVFLGGRRESTRLAPKAQVPLGENRNFVMPFPAFLCIEQVTNEKEY